MRALKVGAALVAALGAVLACVALAQAGNVKQTAAAVEVAPGATRVAKAPCGKLKRLGTGKVSLVGAGFTATGISTFNQGLLPRRRQVQSHSKNAGVETSKAKVFGYCTKRVKTRIRRIRSPLTAGATHNVFVACEKGETAIAGGWKILEPVPSSWAVLNSVRQGRGSWVVSVASASAGTVRAYAVCTPKQLPLAARRSTKVPSAPGAIAKATVKCPAGTAAMSGGFSTNADEGTPFTDALVPVSSRRTGGRTWLVGASAEVGTGNFVRSHVYCLEQPVG